MSSCFLMSASTASSESPSSSVARKASLLATQLSAASASRLNICRSRHWSRSCFLATQALRREGERAALATVSSSYNPMCIQWLHNVSTLLLLLLPSYPPLSGVPPQVSPLSLQSVQFLLYLSTGKVPAGQQLLTRGLKRVEPALPGLSLCVVLLQQQQAGYVGIYWDMSGYVRTCWDMSGYVRILILTY